LPLTHEPVIDWILWFLLEQHVIHLIIIRLECYSQRCVTVNVLSLYLFRVVFQDKLKNSVLAAYQDLRRLVFFYFT
jgi:hypothetical protein